MSFIVMVEGLLTPGIPTAKPSGVQTHVLATHGGKIVEEILN